MATTKTHDTVIAQRRGTPRCPACRESDEIEPLMQQDGVWHVRCLQCSHGFRFVYTTWPSSAERRVTPDRRAVARAGRRATDLPHPMTCPACESADVHGWLRTGETLWARCGACGRVQRARGL